MTKSQIRVRYAETDAMGIVHHSRYYPWFEIARDEFVKSLGFKYSQMEKEGLCLPLIETGAKYKEGARYDDELTVTCKLTKMTYVRCTFTYEVIRNSDNKVLTVGKTSHAFCNSHLNPINLKKKFPHYFEKLINLVSDAED
jgi:acyl-CoA thioester hydrolase